MPVPNKQLKNGCPRKSCASQDFEVEEAKPMNEYEFQSAVLDWFLKIDEEIRDLKKLIEENA